MSKVMEVTTYDKTTNSWKPPVPLGALAENVELTNGNDLQNVIGNYSDTEPSIANKLSKILNNSQLGLGSIQEVAETEDSGGDISGNNEVDIISGDTLKACAEKYNRRGLRTQNIINTIDNKISKWLNIFNIVNNHNQFYRGINLIGETNSPFTSIEELIAAITSKDFSNIYIGDYFDVDLPETAELIPSQTTRLIVMHLNYSENLPGVLLMPKDVITLFSASMDSTSNGYLGTNMATIKLPALTTIFENTLGHTITTGSITLSDEVNNDVPSKGMNGTNGASVHTGTLSGGLFLPNEDMVFGHQIFSSSGLDSGNMTQQLAGFRLCPHLIVKQNKRNKPFLAGDWLLSSVANSTNFCCVAYNGEPKTIAILVGSSSLGIAPVIHLQ